MILHWWIRTGSDRWFSICGSGLDLDWKISQSAHLWDLGRKIWQAAVAHLCSVGRWRNKT